ncbi:efflux RND transporter periplasmic adaptor subunit [Rhizobium rhizogenes]|uniref:efflux RND transporter periplasmic adaptor subunit n=1 Tax=Rhizobium rhizogenes TaxID=359 RepID=UPI0015716C3C|nr:efflux RND transporter periplasmic adaptor subunit [Rhizobium rhizogenes]NTF98261.1 efflux RND transporter periplasmic adaptor subunit [Rhizobium rhizogenes]
MSLVRTTFLTGLLLSSAVGLQACDKGETAQSDPRLQPPLVRSAFVSDPEKSERTFTGTVTARVQSDLGFRVTGKVTQRLVDTGENVRKGQLLFKIDNTDYDLAIDAERASVEAARAEVVQTSDDERRFKNLVATGAVSETNYSRAKAAADVALAKLNAAEAQVRVTENTASYSELVADSDGTVLETLVEPGQVVAAGQAVVRLAHAGPREASIDLPETFLPLVGSTAHAVVFNSDDRGDATLRQLANSADPSTRTFEARYVLDGAAASAPIGSTINITIPEPATLPFVRVPLSAIFDAGKGPGVWLIANDDTVHFTTVHVASLDAESAAISEGLQKGNRFVALGAHLLREDQKVRIAQGDLQ